MTAAMKIRRIMDEAKVKAAARSDNERKAAATVRVKALLRMVTTD